MRDKRRASWCSAWIKPEVVGGSSRRNVNRGMHRIWKLKYKVSGWDRERESEMEECESRRRCGRGSRRAREAGVYGLQMWRNGVLAGAMRSLNPALAGWHRGEREVIAPQHTAHKTLRVVGEKRERIGLKYSLTQDCRAVSTSHFGVRHAQAYPNILCMLSQAHNKAIS